MTSFGRRFRSVFGVAAAVCAALSLPTACGQDARSVAIPQAGAGRAPIHRQTFRTVAAGGAVRTAAPAAAAAEAAPHISRRTPTSTRAGRDGSWRPAESLFSVGDVVLLLQSF